MLSVLLPVLTLPDFNLVVHRLHHCSSLDWVNPTAYRSDVRSPTAGFAIALLTPDNCRYLAFGEETTKTAIARLFYPKYLHLVDVENGLGY
ncbi:MAG: hypothetical protein AAF810_21100 [Cyanobacteria bacterium P01_D01_bin.36]